MFLFDKLYHLPMYKLDFYSNELWFSNKNEIYAAIIKCWCRTSQVNSKPNIYSSVYSGSSSKAHGLSWNKFYPEV